MTATTNLQLTGHTVQPPLYLRASSSLYATMTPPPSWHQRAWTNKSSYGTAMTPTPTSPPLNPKPMQSPLYTGPIKTA